MAVEDIAKRNQRRHAHNSPADLDFCKRCGSFVDKGTPNGDGTVRYTCGACGRGILEHAASD